MKPTGHSLIDQEIGKRLGEDEVVLLADGLESAFLGIGRQFTHPVAIYSYKKTIKCLKGMGMTIEDADRILRLQHRRSIRRRPNSSLPTG
jgi:hypothetical protein